MNSNQTNNRSDEYETHVPALIFLVLAVLVICFVALTWSHEINESGTTSPNASSSLSTSSTSVSTSSGGSIVPIKRVSGSQASGVSGLPAGLFVADQSAIIRNTQTSLSGNQTQWVIIFDTARGRTDLAAEYQAWVKQSDFTLSVNQPSDSATTLVATRGEDQLTIAIMDTAGGSRVQLNYRTPTTH